MNLNQLFENTNSGGNYAEQLAKQVFDKRQDITSEDEVLNQAYHIVSNDQGQKSARYLFNYDADFPSDLVSNYFHLQKQGVAEGFDGEYDDEAGMAQGNLHTIARAAQGLLDTIDDRENLPEWVQEKIAKVEGMMVSAWDYLKSQEEQGIDPRQDLDEVGGRNYHANRTGFARGTRDPERHDLDVAKQPSQQVWALKINGNVDGTKIFNSKDQALKARLAKLSTNPELEIGLVTRGGPAN